MESIALIAILVVILLAAAISRRIEATPLTLPIVYTLAGLLLSVFLLELMVVDPVSEIIRLLAELTLVIVLATDASRINLRRLGRDHILPLRLLVIGLPLMMLLGAVAAAFVFSARLIFWEAAILAIVLAPTDASLGQAVISNRQVPVRVRQALNIESGLNDGLAVPFLVVAVSLALATEEPLRIADFLSFGVAQIAFGLAAGLAIGFLGSRFLAWGQRSGWMAPAFQKLSYLALAVLAYALAGLIGGNGFIAAFVMGVTSANVATDEETAGLHEHAEVEVQLLIMLTFLIFGAVLLPPALEMVDGPIVIYALLSLVLLRPLSVALSLIGTRVRPLTTLFLGWFGPRGTASILYIFLVLDEDSISGGRLIYTAAMITVLLSVFAHGLTAAPGARWYAGRLAAIGRERPEAIKMEMADVPEMPLRHPSA